MGVTLVKYVTFVSNIIVTFVSNIIVMCHWSPNL
jgi:hypothetical protein